MSRVTKQISEEVAKKMVAKKRTEVKDDFKDLSNQIALHHESNYPEIILENIDSISEFLALRESVSLGWDFGYFNVKLSSGKKLIVEPKENRIIFKNENFRSKFHQEYQSIQKRLDEVSSLEIEIAQTLYNLRTYANVEKHFIDAFDLLPVKTTSAIQINVSYLLEKLK